MGAMTARQLCEQNVSEVVLLDIIEGMPQGKALDIAHSAYIQGFTSRISGTNDYKEITGSDLVIITSGASRKPGMSRDQLTSINLDIVSQVISRVGEHAPQAVVIVVTNPVDAMTYLAIKKGGFAEDRVVGLSGLLDSSRLAYLISKTLGVPVTDIDAHVFGQHGQSMVVFPRLVSVRGIPLTKMLPASVIADLVDRTINSGAEVIDLLKSSSAYYAPSATVARMAEAIIGDRHEILPCSVYLNGQYGLYDVCLGVPARLGASGVEEVIELDLKGPEKRKLGASSKVVKKVIRDTGIA